MDGQRSAWAVPRLVESLQECDFYHTMEIPGFGLVEGMWDLREGVGEYLGHTDFAGQRVLEIGTASGFLCFEMERLGAEVVAFDLSEEYDWDIVPIAGVDVAAESSARKAHIRRLNNGFWLAHRALASRARAVHGTVYRIPAEIGEVDVCVVGCVLMHLRDPFLALQQALRLTRHRAVITDSLDRRALLGRLARRLLGPYAHFLPDAAAGGPTDSWWRLSPDLVSRMVGVLGFRTVSLSFHQYPFKGVPHRLFTVVAERH